MARRYKSPPIKLRIVTLHYHVGAVREVPCYRFWDSRNDKRLGLQLDANQDAPHKWMFVPEDQLSCWVVEDADAV